MSAEPVKILYIAKLEFMNESVAFNACVALEKSSRSQIGSAVVVAVTLKNINDIATVCFDFNGYYADTVTDYDRDQVKTPAA